MDFLKPPTDNLYKFISIGGLLLFSISAIYPYFLMKEVDLRVAEMGKLNGTMRLQNEDARDELSRQERMLEQLATDIPKANSQRKFQKLDEQLEAARSSNARAFEKARDAQKTSVDFEYLASVNDFYMGVFRDAAYWSKRGIIAGLILTFLGFSLWYGKWQRYQDKILQNQVASSGRNQSRTYGVGERRRKKKPSGFYS